MRLCNLRLARWLRRFAERPSLLLLSISLSGSFLPQPSPAQTSIPQPSNAPLELSLLEPALNNGAIAATTVNCEQINALTANTICQQQLTIPSLWWANEQFGGNLLENWLAYPGNTTNARIDLLVNRQNWSLIDYVERYEFVNHFGTVARDYGYNVRVFNYQKELLATYTCNFSISPNVCDIQLEATGKSRIRVSSDQF